MGADQFAAQIMQRFGLVLTDQSVQQVAADHGWQDEWMITSRRAAKAPPPKSGNLAAIFAGKAAPTPQPTPVVPQGPPPAQVGSAIPAVAASDGVYVTPKRPAVIAGVVPFTPTPPPPVSWSFECFVVFQQVNYMLEMILQIDMQRDYLLTPKHLCGLWFGDSLVSCRVR